MTQTQAGAGGSRDERNAIDKAISLLTAFRGYDSTLGISLSELARRTQLSKSTAHRTLATLMTNGVVERVGNAYRLGHRLYDLGGMVYTPNHDRIRDALTPFLADLYELSHETVHIAVLHGTDIMYLNKLHGHRVVRSPSRIGGRVPAYCTSLGKVLLAHDAAATEATLSAGLVGRTSKTIVDPTLFMDQLTTIRRDGIAFDDEELMPGLSCVAVPVLGPNGRSLAALSISGAAGSMDSRAQAASLRRVGHAASQAVSRTLARAASG